MVCTKITIIKLINSTSFVKAGVQTLRLDNQDYAGCVRAIVYWDQTTDGAKKVKY